MTRTHTGRDDMLVSEHKKLSRAVVEFAESLGGIAVLSGEHGQYFDGHDIETKAGTMRIEHVKSHRGFVHCRFADPDRASAWYYGQAVKPMGIASGRLNPFSGKFNFHFGRVTADEAMDEIRYALNEFLV